MNGVCHWIHHTQKVNLKPIFELSLFFTAYDKGAEFICEYLYSIDIDYIDVDQCELCLVCTRRAYDGKGLLGGLKLGVNLLYSL